ncbi:MAG: arsinothricin resistance N-acetyltransferase ArsN1 family B [Planctomycetota bacterium]
MRTIRAATALDATAIGAIYEHYVLHTTVSFEERAPDAVEMAQRIEAVHADELPWLVLEDAGQLVGYAYATKWKTRSAYRHSVETSVYLDHAAVGKGFGTQLYSALLDELRARDLHVAIGGIALPNAASIALHEKLGFRKVAQFEEVGWKFGKWVDVGYWELLL